MGIRRSIANIVLGPPEVTEADLRRVASEAALSGGGSSVDPELEARMAKLEKKLNMAMGAVQAATAQIMAVKKDLAETLKIAKQAAQHGTTARATAEATADGLNGVEEQLAKLIEQLGSVQAAPAKRTGKKPGRKKTAEGCKVDGCENGHRARGYCAKHYQQFKRGTLA